MKKLCFYTFLITLILWFAGFLAFTRIIYSFPIDRQTKTEAIIVLTGGRNRIAEAVHLLNEGKADKLLISGVDKDTSLQELSKRKDITIKTNREIHLDKQSKNTIQNAIETHKWLEQNKISSIRLVTSNYHIPRSLEEFTAQDQDLKIVIHPVFSDYVVKEWWKKWRSFWVLAAEYNKFIYVYVTKRLHLDYREEK